MARRILLVVWFVLGGAAAYVFVGRGRRGVVLALANLAIGCLTVGALLLAGGHAEFFLPIILAQLVILGDLQHVGYSGPSHWKRGLLAVLLFGSSSYGVTQTIRTHFVQAFRAPTGAMSPTILAGDYFFANKMAYRHQLPQRGDVVVFRPSAESSTLYISRVLGLPGDVISYESKQVLVNGVTDGGMSCKCPFKEQVVPEDSLFLVGDNRPKSFDSRRSDAVHRNNVLGRVFEIYFSQDPETWRLRLDRVGRRVE